MAKIPPMPFLLFALSWDPSGRRVTIYNPTHEARDVHLTSINGGRLVASDPELVVDGVQGRSGDPFR